MNHRHGQSGIAYHLANKKILPSKYNKLLYIRYMKLWTGAAIIYIFNYLSSRINPAVKLKGPFVVLGLEF